MPRLAATSGLTSLRLIDKVSRYAKRQRSGQTSNSWRSWCLVISFWNFLAWSRPFSRWCMRVPAKSSSAQSSAATSHTLKFMKLMAHKIS